MEEWVEREPSRIGWVPVDGFFYPVSAFPHLQGGPYASTHKGKPISRCQFETPFFPGKEATDGWDLSSTSSVPLGVANPIKILWKPLKMR